MMTYPIKSTLCFACLGLVAGALLVSGGCFDASSKRSGSERGAAESTDTAGRGQTDAVAPVLNTVALSTGDDASLNAATLESPVETPTHAGQAASTERKTSLPKSINWDIPKEKPAVAEEKIAADKVETLAAQKTQMPPTESNEPTETKPANPTGGENPFAIIDESMENAIPLPPTEEAIGEDVWEQGQAANHDSLEHLEIKKQTAEQGAMQPDSPGGKIVPDTVPEMMRKEPGRKSGTKKPADTAATDLQKTESKAPSSFGDTAWEGRRARAGTGTWDRFDVGKRRQEGCDRQTSLA